jgi:hypothetical protein
MSTKPKLTVETQADSYRLRCPNGHQVAPTNEHWYCRQCAQYWDDDVDPEYDVAIDSKTGQELTRDDVELDFEAPGVYYA